MSHDKAEREKDIIKSLISDISHQTRTPLANIMLYSGLLQEQELDGQSAELVGRIQKQSEKLDFFMKELVRTSYIEQEMISVRPEKTAVCDIVDAACQAVELEAMKKSVVIVREEADEFCIADVKWTAEAIGNILDNAIKYSPEGASVTVRCVALESFICVEIADSGGGIDEREHGKIFERFYRSDNAVGKPGSGIGLYLAREIIGKQGGYIKVESAPGEGTRMKVFIPRREIPAGR